MQNSQLLNKTSAYDLWNDMYALFSFCYFDIYTKKYCKLFLCFKVSNVQYC